MDMAGPRVFTMDTDDLGEDYNDTDYVYQDYSGDPTYSCYEEEQDLQSLGAAFQPVLYSLIFLLGVLGNGLMITVLLRRWRLLRITEIYLLHLALADLMLLLTFPFDVVDIVTGWVFGEFLCKLVGLMRHLNLLCGSFLLACIGFDRYLAIVHAIPSMRNRRPRAVHVTCISLWLVCLGLSVPNVVFLTVREDINDTSSLSCDHFHHNIHGHNWVLTARVFDHVSFFLPLTVMSYCYTAVVVTLCKSQKSQAKQGAMRLAVVITLVFCFCWLPYNITLLVQTLVDFKVINYTSCRPHVVLMAARDVTLGLGFSHCCLNPFLYAFVGVQFRKELNRLLRQLGCGAVCLPFFRSQGQSRPSVSDGATTISSTI
ncbi:C-X-C chemokine receptor type 5 isoform X2 [Pleuronectes platessa]|uniref:C-X-C chemokine receptor type 5 isoform X2 n=1 Tax=Pleuronectes platessa TaxID=8262 RepID=UPI00232A2497|nr:C-X-C chemokine receptor type 5 isoform X2 [Pleuronectes platessa]